MSANPFIGVMISDWSEPNSQFVDGIRIGLAKQGEDWKYRSFVGQDGQEAARDYKLDGYILGPSVQALPSDQPRVRGVSWNPQATDINQTACLVAPDTIAQMAHRHLVNHGFHSVAVISADAPHCQVLFDAFLAYTTKQATTATSCQTFLSNADTTEDDLGAFLAKLEPGTGIFCTSDLVAQWTRDQCLIDGLSVPQSLGILGMGNRPQFCLSQEPAISSISLPMRSIGHMAFDALRLTMLHRQTRHSPREIRLLSIVSRSTTAPPAIQLNPLTKRAEQLIRRHLAKPWTVTEMAKRLGTSTATLNRHWKEDHNDSIHAWRTRQRMEWAVELLDQGQLSTSAIAKKTGIGSYSMLARLLTRHYEATPSDLREREPS